MNFSNENEKPKSPIQKLDELFKERKISEQDYLLWLRVYRAQEYEQMEMERIAEREANPNRRYRRQS